ncbi:MAG: DUF998 domain-containing protein [Friedmanniella sp.]
MTYNTWLLWRPANGHAAIFDGYLSELSASDQPHHLLFRFEDLLTALIVLAQAVRAALFWAERVRQRRVADPRLLTRWWFVAWLGLLIFAVSTLLDSFFAMDCSPTLSAACRAAEQSGSLSRVHYLHTYTSVSAETGIVIAMVAACLALGRVRHGGGRLRTMRHLVLGLAVAHLVALTTMMTLLAAGLPGLGYAQAVMVLVASIGFALVGFALAFARNWARAPDVTRELLAEPKRARW